LVLLSMSWGHQRWRKYVWLYQETFTFGDCSAAIALISGIGTNDVATLFGLQLARLVVDTSSPELMRTQQDVEQRTKKPSRRG
jgi:hypothetical protein